MYTHSPHISATLSSETVHVGYGLGYCFSVASLRLVSHGAVTDGDTLLSFSFFSHRPQKYWPSWSAPTLSAFPGDRLSSVLVNSAAKIFILSLGVTPWIVWPRAVPPLHPASIVLFFAYFVSSGRFNVLNEWMNECLYYDIWQTADEITTNGYKMSYSLHNKNYNLQYDLVWYGHRYIGQDTCRPQTSPASCRDAMVSVSWS